MSGKSTSPSNPSNCSSLPPSFTSFSQARLLNPADLADSSSLSGLSYIILLGSLKSVGGELKFVLYETALRLYFRNKRVSTLHGRRFDRRSVWIFLATLNSRSLAQELAGGARYVRDSLAKFGKRSLLPYHQRNYSI